MCTRYTNPKTSPHIEEKKQAALPASLHWFGLPHEPWPNLLFRQTHHVLRCEGQQEPPVETWAKLDRWGERLQGWRFKVKYLKQEFLNYGRP